MNTTVKAGRTGTLFVPDDLVNGDKITALIHEAVAQMNPCIHCGHDNPHIGYLYHAEPLISPSYNIDVDNPTTAKPHPHELFGQCSADVGYCGMRTQEWLAEDNETDFKEALRRIVTAWNRRADNLSKALVKKDIYQ